MKDLSRMEIAARLSKRLFEAACSPCISPDLVRDEAFRINAILTRSDEFIEDNIGNFSDVMREPLKWKEDENERHNERL